MKVLNMSIGSAVLFLTSMNTHAGDVISSTASSTTQFVVKNFSEATVTLNTRKDLSAGSVPTAFQLGTWTGKIDAGTLAYRVNRQINPVDPANPTNPTGGVASNSSDSTKKLAFFIAYNTTTSPSSQIIDGWRVMVQGVTAMSASVSTSGAQVLLSGRYPIGLDVAAYAF